MNAPHSKQKTPARCSVRLPGSNKGKGLTGAKGIWRTVPIKFERTEIFSTRLLRSTSYSLSAACSAVDVIVLTSAADVDAAGPITSLSARARTTASCVHTPAWVLLNRYYYTLFQKQGASCRQAASKGCQMPTPCWTRRIQARPNPPWARCSVFVLPPASRGPSMGTPS
jgi:hypothetical protein